MYGLPEARTIFNVVFFVVIVSAILQGWTLRVVASLLGLQTAKAPTPAVSLELMSLRDVDAEIVDYVVVPASPLVNKSVQELQLPDGAILAMISRGQALVAPRGSTVLRPHDHLFVIVSEGSRKALSVALGEATMPEA
jgi:cell volume regulation protein A